MSAATRRRLVPRARPRGRLPRPGPRAFALLLAVAAVLTGGFFWVRQSSLVAVRRVTITGVSGPGAAQIRSALAGAARGMSTLDLDAGRLHSVVAAYPVVRGLHLHADFPHGLRIVVSEKVPVAVLVAGGSRTTIAADGTLLRGSPAHAGLPTITSSVIPGGSHVTAGARAEVAVLAAAPYALLGRASSAERSASRGLAVTLRDGPTIVFGPDTQLAAKWRAAIAVLAAPSSAGASYIDVTDPARPAAGTGVDASGSSAATPTTSTSGATTSTSSPGDTSTVSVSSTG